MRSATLLACLGAASAVRAWPYGPLPSEAQPQHVSQRAEIVADLGEAVTTSTCNATLDPPNMVRNGGDMVAFPLPANATADDCIALCCSYSLCFSFSYNNPQPEESCLGGSCCEVGGVCCMLKNLTMPLTNNTYGPGVRTGILNVPASPLPAPTPLFPVSTLIQDVSIGPRQNWSGNGDTWPTAVTPDGLLYGWCCDSQNNGQPGTPMSAWQLVGDPYIPGSLTPLELANEPLDYMTLCADYHPGQFGNTKPGGMIALNTTLYVGVSCINYGDGDQPMFMRQHNLAGFIAASYDRGLTWTNITAVGAFPGPFAAPVLVNCGAGTPCIDERGLPWIYVFFHAGADAQAYWENNDATFLARVPPDLLANVSAYQYWVGTNPASGSPLWSADPVSAQPVLYFSRMIGENAIHYNAAIGRFIMANFGFVHPIWGVPFPWHQFHQDDMTPRRTQLLFLEAPNPWGPWSVFYRDDDAAIGGGHGMYTPTFPAAYHQPVTPNGTAEMMLFFSCAHGPDCYYTLNWAPVTLTLAPSARR